MHDPTQAARRAQKARHPAEGGWLELWKLRSLQLSEMNLYMLHPNRLRARRQKKSRAQRRQVHILYSSEANLKCITQENVLIEIYSINISKLIGAITSIKVSNRNTPLFRHCRECISKSLSATVTQNREEDMACKPPK